MNSEELFKDKFFKNNMKTLKLIYSDSSGNRTFKNSLDQVIEIFTDAGYHISVLRAKKLEDIQNSLINKDYHTIVAAGGDGTLNAVVNSVLKNNINTKIGIIPAGTANDFARYLNIQKPYYEAAKIIAEGKTKKVDIGRINDSFFVNVFGIGLITNISNYVDLSLKNTLGNMAYYLKALEKIQNLEPMSLTIKNSSEIINEKLLFFLALNSGGAGGFDNLTESDISDGKFDCVGVKECTIPEAMALLLSFLKGEHLQNDNVLYYRDNYTEILYCSHQETNVDGEKGPSLPIKLTMGDCRLDIYVP